MNHTPGKWQVETAATSRDGKTVVTEYFVRRDGDSMAIANDITDPETETMSEANARLIAAAPDMLHALRCIANMETWADGLASDKDIARAALSWENESSDGAAGCGPNSP